MKKATQSPPVSKGIWVFGGVAALVAGIGLLYLFLGGSSGEKSKSEAVRRIEKLEQNGDVSALTREAERLDDSEAASAAVRSLGHVAVRTNANIQPQLEQAIQHAKPEVRAAAAEQLGDVAIQRQTDEPPPVLLKAAVTDQDQVVRGVAMQKLGQMKTPQTIETLLQGLYDPDVQVRRYAYEGIQQTIGVKFKPGTYDPEASEDGREIGVQRIVGQVRQFKDYLLTKPRRKPS